MKSKKLSALLSGAVALSELRRAKAWYEAGGRESVAPSWLGLQSKEASEAAILEAYRKATAPSLGGGGNWWQYGIDCKGNEGEFIEVAPRTWKTAKGAQAG